MRRRIIWLAGVVILLAAVAGAGARQSTRANASAGESWSPCNNGKSSRFELASTIAFSSSRDNPNILPVADATEIYLMDPDGTNLRRLTENTSGDGFATLAPDGTRIVFDSDRLSGHVNVSDLFLMNADGSGQTFLTRGSSASWSPDCKEIAFHASASGSGTPIRTDPGSATTDSDIFVANVDDLLAGSAGPRNLTNSVGMIDDDPDWSPDGQHIVYTAHPATDQPTLSNQAEIYVMKADGTGTPQRLTDNGYEERGPDWSPDGTRIEFMCRIGGGSADFELCVMNADGSNLIQLTDNTVQDLSANWSPDGQQLIFHRPVAGPGSFQLFVINSNLNSDGTRPTATPLIFPFPPGVNAFADWGVLRVKS